LKAGSEPPPIVLWQGPNKLIDGLNRLESYRRFYGEDAEIPAIYRTYKTEAAALEDAMLLNDHGEMLDETDIARCYELARECGLPEERVARIVGRTMDDLKKLVHNRVARTGRGENQEPVILKGCVAHMAGTTLTRAQVEVNEKLTGTRQLKQVRDVYYMVSEDMLDAENEYVVTAAKDLHDALTTWIKEHA
jgi:hypothetical protein